MHMGIKDKKHLIKWLARIIGGLAILFFGTIIIGEGVPEFKEGIPAELRSVIILLGFATLGYIFAWFREKEGGLTMSIAGVILGLNMFYMGGTKDTWAVLIFSLPFLVPGLMFWWVGLEKEKG
ncbi:MAG: hypothetical protein KQI35_09770 [Bacteroidetes bacterium]|nr:hypothetical protein [Bacteroidota bacterium]